MSARLSVENLNIRFQNAPILRDLTFSVAQGRILGITGESGSGKSSLGLSLMGLLPPCARLKAASFSTASP